MIISSSKKEKLVADVKTRLQVFGPEAVPLEKKALERYIQEIPFGQMDVVAQTLAQQIYLELQKRNVYDSDPKTFWYPNSLVQDFINKIYKPLLLSNNQTIDNYNRRWCVLVNLTITYLSLQIFQDPKFNQDADSLVLGRDLLDALKASKMPVGLHSLYSEHSYLRTDLIPEVFFDRQQVPRRPHEKLLDSTSFNNIVKQLQKLKMQHPKNIQFQTWCDFKLYELQHIASIIKNRRDVSFNNPLLSIPNAHELVYKFR